MVHNPPATPRTPPSSVPPRRPDRERTPASASRRPSAGTPGTRWPTGSPPVSGAIQSDLHRITRHQPQAVDDLPTAGAVAAIDRIVQHCGNPSHRTAREDRYEGRAALDDADRHFALWPHPATPASTYASIHLSSVAVSTLKVPEQRRQLQLSPGPALDRYGTAMLVCERVCEMKSVLPNPINTRVLDFAGRPPTDGAWVTRRTERSTPAGSPGLAAPRRARPGCPAPAFSPTRRQGAAPWYRRGIIARASPDGHTSSRWRMPTRDTRPCAGRRRLVVPGTLRWVIRRRCSTSGWPGPVAFPTLHFRLTCHTLSRRRGG